MNQELPATDVEKLMMRSRLEHANRLTRRNLLKLTAGVTLGAGSGNWFQSLAADTATHPERKRSCILLWMQGGPSQMDTFDLKPGHANGGPFKAIDTNVPGIRISEHLPNVARQMDQLAIVRSMSTHEADHDRAAFYLRTGYKPQAGVQYPSLGSLVAREQMHAASALPPYVSVASPRLASDSSYGSGYLGPQYAPMLVGTTSNLADFYNADRYSDAALSVRDLGLSTSVSETQQRERVRLLEAMQQRFSEHHPGNRTSNNSFVARTCGSSGEQYCGSGIRAGG